LFTASASHRRSACPTTTRPSSQNRRRNQRSSAPSAAARGSSGTGSGSSSVLKARTHRPTNHSIDILGFRLRREDWQRRIGLTEDAHGAVDDCGGYAVARGRAAAALEAAEEGQVSAEELGLVVGVVGHVVAVAAKVEVVDGAAVPEHGAGLLAAGPVGSAVVAVAREQLRQPRPRAAVLAFSG